MENTKDGKKMNKKMNKALLMGTALVSLSAAPMNQAQAITQSLAISAVILAPIVVATVNEIDFGSMTVALAGSMDIDTAGTRTIPSGAGTVTAVTGAGNDRAGRYSITAAPSAVLTVALTAGPVSVTGPGPAMVVSNFVMATTIGAANPLTAAMITLPLAGVVNVDVGARLNVAASPGQTAGTYTGNYSVIVNYM